MVDQDASHSDLLPVVEDPWAHLRQFTDARIGLGRAGISQPTRHHLAFQLAHARARDAVHQALDVAALGKALAASAPLASLDVLQLHSAAEDRNQYLQRPDLGRQLNSASLEILQTVGRQQAACPDLAIAMVDGLSARAIELNAVPFLESFCASLAEEDEAISIAPLSIVEQGRVAVGDAVGEWLQARCVLVLIGERPGLSSPDSMGLYLTWQPRVGRNDAERNCISNIRPAGLSYREASRRALYLLREARRIQCSGVALKDRSDASLSVAHGGTDTFLTGG